MQSNVRPSFARMEDSTEEDWAIIAQSALRAGQGLADRVLTHLRLLDNDYGGFPIDRLQHSLQTANLAAEAGEDDEYIVCALLHDVGDTLGSANHADVSAAILEPFVSEENHWMVKHHAIFQGYNFFHHIGLNRNLRDEYKDNPNYARTARFIVKYDNPAFDAAQPRLDLEPFEDRVRKVFSTPRKSLYTVPDGADAMS